MQIAGLLAELNFYLIDEIDDDDSNNNEEEEQKEEKEEETLKKINHVGHKKKFHVDILLAIEEKGNYRQFKYLCYKNRARRIQNIFVQIIPACVDKKELKSVEVFII